MPYQNKMQRVMEIIQILFVISLLFVVSNSQRAKRNLDCGLPGVLTAQHGVIKSHAGFDAGHNYGKGLHCVWHIQAPVGMKVELTEDSFDVDGIASNCQQDWLALYDGPGLNSTQIGKYCGTSFPVTTSSGRWLTLEFVTNTYTSGAGFKLNYNFTTSLIRSCQSTLYICGNHKCIRQSYRCDGDDDCGDDTDEQHCPPFTCHTADSFPCRSERKCILTAWLCDGDSDCNDGSDEKPYNCKGGAWKCGILFNNGTSGSIMTPGYPLTNYPNNLNCHFEILAPVGKSVQLTFESRFNIESDVKCAYDFLKVYSDNSTFLHGPYCGNTAPSSFTIPSNHVIVEFNADKSDNYAGFKANWKAV